MQKKFTIKKNTVKVIAKRNKKQEKDTTSTSITKKTMTSGLQVSIISAANIDASNYDRLETPIAAEKRKRLENGTASKARRRAVKDLTFKSAPPVPTAPKDPRVIRRNWLISQAKSHIKLIDIPLIFFTLILAVFGLFAIFSSTASYGSHRYVIVQGFSLIIGTFAALILSVIDYRSIAEKYRYIIALNAFILVITLIFGEGVTGETNKNWINLGPVNIQPSEFAKLLFIFSFAVHLAQVRDKMHRFSTVFSLGIHAMIIFALVLLQGDIGILTIFLVIFVAMCFAAGLSIWYYIAGAAAAVCVSPFLWARLDQYQKDRIMLCFDPSIDPYGLKERYQQMWSQKAISNGGIFGTGYTKGVTTQHFDDPTSAKHTDMIYSTICEELGLVGALLVLTLTCFIIFRIMKLAIRCDNNAGRYICVGVASMFMIQVIENVGMCLGIMPVIGITYPFLSYGGSSILSCMLAIGMVLSVSTHREQSFFS